MTINKKIKGTQHHHKLILHSSCHFQRVLVVATKAEQGTIRVGNERHLVITGALIASTVTQRETSFHHRWYMCLLHWIIQLSIHLSCPRFIKSHPDLHRTILVITGALIASTVTQRAISFHNRWLLGGRHKEGRSRRTGHDPTYLKHWKGEGRIAEDVVLNIGI